MSLTNKELYEYIQDVEEKTHNRITKNSEEISEMKGGIKFAKWFVPIVVVVVGGLLGAYMKVSTDGLKAEMRSYSHSSGKATSVEVNETTGKLEPINEIREELPREMPAAPK